MVIAVSCVSASVDSRFVAPLLCQCMSRAPLRFACRAPLRFVRGALLLVYCGHRFGVDSDAASVPAWAPSQASSPPWCSPGTLKGLAWLGRPERGGGPKGPLRPPTRSLSRPSAKAGVSQVPSASTSPGGGSATVPPRCRNTSTCRWGPVPLA